MSNNYFSYKRISTKEDRGLQKFNRQEAALKKYAADNGIEFIAEFKEDESGKSFDNRKEWNKLEKLAQAGDRSTLSPAVATSRAACIASSKVLQSRITGIISANSRFSFSLSRPIQIRALTLRRANSLSGV